MPEIASPHEWDPLNRFKGLSDIYARSRPSYPEASVDYICQCCQLDAGSLLVDVGCGTGISSRLFARRGITVAGIEPNEEMLSNAQAENEEQPVGGLTFQLGRAEATKLRDDAADAVLAAQAFHWFQSKEAFDEFNRILKPGGWIALMWNERDDSDPFTADCSAVIRSTTEARTLEDSRARAGESLLTCRLFENGHRKAFANEQIVDEDGMLGRALSASYAPRETQAREDFIRDLRKVFVQHQQQGAVALQYVTSLYLAGKPLK